MKKTLSLAMPFFALLVLAGQFCPVRAAETKPAQDKAAIVNGAVITTRELDRAVQGIQRSLLRAGRVVSPGKLGELRKRVLENLIEQELLFQESQKNGVKIEKARVNAEVERLRKQFPSKEAFEKGLKEVNLSESELRFYITRQLTIQKFIDKEFVEKIKISEQMLKDYYDNHKNFFKKPEQVRASHILVKIDPKADESQKAQARKKLETIKERVEKGEDFNALAREYSQAPSASKGGDLGYFSRGRMVKSFEDAAFSLKPGEVSDIVETRYGYHLIKVTDRKPPSMMAYLDVKEKIRQHLKDMTLRREEKQFMHELKAKSKIERFFDQDKEGK